MRWFTHIELCRIAVYSQWQPCCFVGNIGLSLSPLGCHKTASIKWLSAARLKSKNSTFNVRIVTYVKSLRVITEELKKNLGSPRRTEKKKCGCKRRWIREDTNGLGQSWYTTVLTQIASSVHARHLIRTSQPQPQPLLCGGHLIPIHPLTSMLELERPDGRCEVILYSDDTEFIARTQHFVVWYALQMFASIRRSKGRL